MRALGHADDTLADSLDGSVGWLEQKVGEYLMTRRLKLNTIRLLLTV